MRPQLIEWLVLFSFVLAACATGPQASPTAVSTNEQTPPSPTVTSPPATSIALPAASSTPDAPVSIIIADDALVITNNTPTDLYYAVFPHEELALIEWVPCQHPDDCPEERLEAGQSMSLSLQVVVRAETTVITVFWWQLVENSDGSGYHHVDLTSMDIEFR